MKRSCVAVTLWLLILLLFAPMAFAGQITAFIYHRFDESRYSSTNISAQVFTAQLAELKKQNYQILSLGEIVRRLIAKEPLPEKGAALCVDDAFTSFAEVGMPIIRQFGFPVTLFVNTDAVGSSGYLDWSQLKALQAEGVEIGNHSASHAYLVERKIQESSVAWAERIRADIYKAEQQFQEHLGQPTELFAYPYGEYSPQVIEIVESLGFKAAFAQQSGVIHTDHDLFNLPRFPMGGPFATLEGFKNKLAMKPLIVGEADPENPIIQGNPPELLLNITDNNADLRQLNCFVQGENSCQVAPVPEKAGWFRVIADKPLTGRRNKYTLTAAGKQGGWHWFSQLWVNAKRPGADGYGKE